MCRLGISLSAQPCRRDAEGSRRRAYREWCLFQTPAGGTPPGHRPACLPAPRYACPPSTHRAQAQRLQLGVQAAPRGGVAQAAQARHHHPDLVALRGQAWRGGLGRTVRAWLGARPGRRACKRTRGQGACCQAVWAAQAAAAGANMAGCRTLTQARRRPAGHHFRGAQQAGQQVQVGDGRAARLGGQHEVHRAGGLLPACGREGRGAQEAQACLLSRRRGSSADVKT